MNPRFAVRLAPAAALALLPLACGPDVYEATGVVRQVYPEEGQVVIEHEAIPNFMDAMTMGFDVSDPALLEGLQPGQAVDFRVAHGGRTIRVIELHVRDDLDAAAPRRPRELRRPGDPAPPFELLDQDGRPLALADLRGRAVLVDFVFTHCPGPCPILTASHVTLQRSLAPELRSRVHFVSISLDPERDSPERLRSYASARGVDFDGWSFVTGPLDEVDTLLAAYGVGAVRREDGNIDHTVASFLVDPDGRIVERYLGLEHAAADIERDIRSVLR